MRHLPCPLWGRPSGDQHWLLLSGRLRGSGGPGRAQLGIPGGTGHPGLISLPHSSVIPPSPSGSIFPGAMAQVRLVGSSAFWGASAYRGTRGVCCWICSCILWCLLTVNARLLLPWPHWEPAGNLLWPGELPACGPSCCAFCWAAQSWLQSLRAVEPLGIVSMAV